MDQHDDQAAAEPLHLLDKDEFFDVYRVFRPDASREEYELEWAMFQEFKRAIQRARAKQ